MPLRREVDARRERVADRGQPTALRIPHHRAPAALFFLDEGETAAVGRPDGKRAVSRTGCESARCSCAATRQGLHVDVAGRSRLLDVPFVVSIRDDVRDPASSRRDRDRLPAGEAADGEHVFSSENWRALSDCVRRQRSDQQQPQESR